MSLTWHFIVIADIAAYTVLQHFCRTFSIVDDHVRDAMGEALYDLFMVRICVISILLNFMEVDW